MTTDHASFAHDVLSTLRHDIAPESVAFDPSNAGFVVSTDTDSRMVNLAGDTGVTFFTELGDFTGHQVAAPDVDSTAYAIHGVLSETLDGYN